MHAHTQINVDTDYGCPGCACTRACINYAEASKLKNGPNKTTRPHAASQNANTRKPTRTYPVEAVLRVLELFLDMFARVRRRFLRFAVETAQLVNARDAVGTIVVDFAHAHRSAAAAQPAAILVRLVTIFNSVEASVELNHRPFTGWASIACFRLATLDEQLKNDGGRNVAHGKSCWL